ncbi:whey acidic protein-like [Stegostoma tigrinum]|uniref:whey acidic protein-like n=1 Tax=Stegostoma tigrinum TaxID=3053191 RepID=UPI0028702003|nr:whey acidic protein-like [Stegostoma tigrinum]
MPTAPTPTTMPTPTTPTTMPTAPTPTTPAKTTTRPRPTRPKPRGQCPANTIARGCQQSCKRKHQECWGMECCADGECQGGKRCCPRGMGNKCLRTKEGVCPVNDLLGYCETLPVRKSLRCWPIKCLCDSDCRSGFRCCPHQCGRKCKRAVKVRSPGKWKWKGRGWWKHRRG